MNLLETADFTLDVTGNETGEKYFGTFTVYKRLPHGMQLKRESILRELIGTNPDAASPRAQSQAAIIAELRVSVVKAPDWLKASNFGLDLFDDNVLSQLDQEITKVRDNAREEVKKKVDAAKEALKAEFAKDAK
jgi:hypothetical protein